MIRRKRENTKKVMLTLSEEQIEWGKIEAVKEKVSFSEFVDNLLIQVKEDKKSRLTERRESGSTSKRKTAAERKEGEKDD